MSDVVKALQEWLEGKEDEMLADYRGLLQIPSLEEDALPNAPFGKGNRDALDYMLGLSSKAGMETKDLEGYAGYADFGSGKGMVMTLGHVDVVPVGPGWKHDPFGAEIDGGYVYSRGAVDDKGPTMAAFYAVRAIQEVVGDPGVRVRSVFGCNEESGFKCVEHYMKTEEAPTLGVAPDAGWPCIHAEKGICDFVIDRVMPSGALTVLEFKGGQRPNIVIDSAVMKVRVATETREFVEAAIADSWDKNLSFSWDGDVLTIEAVGKAAHGAYPYGGDNAASRILQFMRDAADVDQQRLFDDWHEVTHLGGNGLGICGADEPSGPLTANFGIVDTVDGKCRMTINVRYPVTWKGEDVKAKCVEALAKKSEDYSLFDFDDSSPLYFPKDHALVKTIVDVCETELGEKMEPKTMGGGTYARAVPNCVAIGTGWAGDGVAHETDERLAVASLYKMARIYAHILYRLTLEAKAVV